MPESATAGNDLTTMQKTHAQVFTWLTSHPWLRQWLKNQPLVRISSYPH